MDLHNHTILITGASHGLGKQLAVDAAAAGAQVLALARNQEKLRALVAQIRQRTGAQIETFVCDLADRDQILTTVAAITEHFPRLDILVNNAGIWTDNELEKTNPSLRHQAFTINALGQIEITEALLPHLEKQAHAQVMNVISTAGDGLSQAGASPDWSTYGATKWAMAGYTKALQDRYHTSPLRVIGFYPGGFDSDLYDSAGRSNAHGQAWMMSVDEVAEMAMFALTRPPGILMEKMVFSKKH